MSTMSPAAWFLNRKARHSPRRQRVRGPRVAHPPETGTALQAPRAAPRCGGSFSVKFPKASWKLETILTSLISCKSSVNSTLDSKFFITFFSSSIVLLTSETTTRPWCPALPTADPQRPRSQELAHPDATTSSRPFGKSAALFSFSLQMRFFEGQPPCALPLGHVSCDSGANQGSDPGSSGQHSPAQGADGPGAPPRAPPPRAVPADGSCPAGQQTNSKDYNQLFCFCTEIFLIR